MCRTLVVAQTPEQLLAEQGGPLVVSLVVAPMMTVVAPGAVSLRLGVPPDPDARMGGAGGPGGPGTPAAVGLQGTGSDASGGLSP